MENTFFAVKLLSSFTAQIRDCTTKIISNNYDTSTISTYSSVISCFFAIIEATGRNCISTPSTITEIIQCFQDTFKAVNDSHLIETSEL